MLQNPPVKDLSSWLDYISHLHPKEMDLGLERVFQVAKRFKNIQLSCPVITITGTNGKGSSVRFLEEIYSSAGYRVGAFTSPHLMSFNERVRINNEWVDDSDLLNAFEEVENSRGDISLSFFEFTFLAALQIFQRSSLDLLILEVGLGGRLDAVNIIDADVAVVTTIDLDHQEWLGADRASIAREKAGIFRPSKPVVCGDPAPPDNLSLMAKELNSPWYGLNTQFHYEIDEQTQTWHWWTEQKVFKNLPALNLKHQNAATSLMVVELLQKYLPVVETQLRQGLEKAKLMGRFEKVMINSTPCYLDVAHNPQGGRWLAEQWKKIHSRGRRIAIFSMLSDKDIAQTINSLLDYIDIWYLTKLDVFRGASLAQLKKPFEARGVKGYHEFASISLALQAAIAAANQNDDIILVFGSFYTVAEARRYLQNERWL